MHNYVTMHINKNLKTEAFYKIHIFISSQVDTLYLFTYIYTFVITGSKYILYAPLYALLSIIAFTYIMYQYCLYANTYVR